MQLAPPLPDEDFWVFAYGSLMWNPGFDWVERRPARVGGRHRALCVYSHVHRGTPDKPGLVLGLDRGGSCRGVAFKVAAERRKSVVDYLRGRELVTDIYREIWLIARLGAETVPALGYVVDRKHMQYAGRLERAALLALVRQGVGHSGANPDYVAKTQAYLRALGIHDATLDWLARQLSADAPV